MRKTTISRLTWIILTVLLGSTTNIQGQVKPDTLVRVRKFIVPFGNNGKPMILYKCLGNKKYIVNVGESDVNCTLNEVTETMSFTDFTLLLQKNYKDNLILADEPYLNQHLTDSLFGIQGFKDFMKNYVYSDCISLIMTDHQAATAAHPAASAASKKSKKKAPDSLNCRNCPDITLLNAANFDFTGKLSTSYLGVFNIFAPNLDDSHFGFIAGIQKINYATVSLNGGSDSGSVRYYEQNYLLNPLFVNRSLRPMPVLPGARYIQEYNQYSFSTSNRVWSIYFQPIWKVLKLSENFPKDGLYAQLHLELMVNQWTQTSSIKNLYTNPDTAISTALAGDSSFYWVKNNPVIVRKNFLTGNFGGGISYYHHLATKDSDTGMHIFAQAIIGCAVNAPNFDMLNNPTSPPHPNGTPSGGPTGFFYPRGKLFYLTRFHFAKALSSGSDLFVGFESRGFFGSPNVQYAVYLGLNLDIGKLAGLLVGS